MKNTTYGICFVLLLALLPGLACAISAQDNALSLTNIAIMPQQVVAGDNVTILFQLYNSYNSGLNDINMQLTGAYPLLNFSPSGSYQISTMGSGVYAGFFNYTIKIPQTTASGTYTLDFVTTYQTTIITGSVVGSSVMPLSFYVNGVPNVTASISSAEMISGNVMSVQVQLINSGYTQARNVDVKFLGTNNLVIQGQNEVSAPTLDAKASISANLEYDVIGSKNSSAFAIPVAISYESGYNTAYSKHVDLTASLQIGSPVVLVTLSNPQPQALYQGHNQSITLVIQNTGSGVAKNVSVSLSPSAGISLMSSVSGFFIEELQPNQAVSEPLLIAANGASNASMVASIQYYKANYQNPTAKSQTLSLSLAPAAQFSVLAQTSALPPGATAVPVTFSISNVGTTEAQNVQLSIQTTYPITPVSGTYFVSSLKPGESTNATFIVNVDSQGVPGNYPVTMYEQWRQPNGAVSQQFSGSNNYFVTVASGGGSGTLLIAIAIIAVVAIGVYFYRKKAASKQKPKK